MKVYEVSVNRINNNNNKANAERKHFKSAAVKNGSFYIYLFLKVFSHFPNTFGNCVK